MRAGPSGPARSGKSWDFPQNGAARGGPGMAAGLLHDLAPRILYSDMLLARGRREPSPDRAYPWNSS